ncbi:MAG: ECF transporter S component [Promethearchaeota archaeon]
MVKIMENENTQLVKPVNVERKVPENKTRIIILNIAIMGILTALETIMTATVSIPIPATTGYFNVGEGIIYFTSILFGPYIGAFVGGVGAGFADVLGGYAIFAPGTFIAKGAEGFLVGLVFKKLRENNTINNNWKVFSLILGLVAGGLMALLADRSVPIIILGGILTLIIWILGFTVQKNISIKILSMMAGGIAMVLGYFLYESLILNLISTGYYSSPLNAALVEIPINILQVLSGIFIAVPLIAALEPVARNYYK